MNQQYTGNKIAELRKEKGWTQKELAEMIHVSTAAVSKWERGLNYPDLSLMEPLAEALETSAAELLGLEQESPEKVIQSITQITKCEKQDRIRENVKRVAWLACILFLFVVVSIFVLYKGRPTETGFFGSIRIDNRGRALMMALILGISSWLFGVAAIFSNRKGMHQRWNWYSICSFGTCAIALYIPSLQTDMHVRCENLSAVLDTAWALHFASLVLLLGTFLLNILSWILNRNHS